MMSWPGSGAARGAEVRRDLARRVGAGYDVDGHVGAPPGLHPAGVTPGGRCRYWVVAKVPCRYGVAPRDRLPCGVSVVRQSVCR